MEGPEESRPFARRRPPSPQATRLMLLSALASIGLAAVLGYVFIPTLLFYEDQPKSPNYQLVAVQEGSVLRVTVDSVFMPGSLSDFEILLLVDSEADSERHLSGPLPSDIPGLMTFTDANGNGILDKDDYFLIELEAGKTYRLLILMVDREREEGVGFLKWPP